MGDVDAQLESQESRGATMSKNKDFDDWDMGKSSFQRCYVTHPALIVGETKIYGGSCSSPIIKDADVYVGFDSSMTRTFRQYPWEQGTEFLYRITDMAAPDDIESFKKLIDFLMYALADGKKVHCGCIGGHGRTGTVFAALVAAATGEKDAITYVRKHYCKKAVESASQVAFLHKHFGIKEVKGYKSGKGWGESHHTGSTRRESWYGSSSPYMKAKEPPKTPIELRVGNSDQYDVTPARNDKVSIWGKNVVFDKSSQSGRILI